jgi:hypothetical protein
LENAGPLIGKRFTPKRPQKAGKLLKKQDGAWGRIRTTDTRIFKRRVWPNGIKGLAKTNLEKTHEPRLGRR